MFNPDSKLKLTDLIDLELLQELQDTFAKTTGVASIAVDSKGPITKPSNFTDFCIKFTRGTQEGYKRCNECDIKWGEIAAQSGKPVIYNCHSGLKDFAVPIVVEGKHIASILGGQILTEKPDEEHFRALARDLGINEDEYMEALGKIKIIPAENVNAAANFLYLVANTISKVAHKNLELIRKNEREEVLRNIISKIRSSLDLDETLSFICDETAKLFNVQRVVLTTFPDPENYEIFTIKKEYKSSENIASLELSEDASKTANYWAKNIIEGEGVFSVDNIEQSKTPDYFKNVYNSMGVKSIMGTPIKRGEDIWGTLILSEYNQYRYWTQEEKSLIKTIANQIYIAINQAELFEQARKKAENEKTIREIMLSSVTSFDIKEIINTIVNEAGKLFKADRCFYIEVDTDTGTNLPIKGYAEYLSSKDVISHVSKVPNKEETGVFLERTTKKEMLYVNNIFKENLPEATKKMLIDELSVKSYLISPVHYCNKAYGSIVLHYTDSYHKFSQDELDMAATIANQSAIVMHQVELYEITKVQSEREKISKNIIEILRSTLDKSIIKKLFVKSIGKFLEADRVLFSEYDYENNKYKPVDSDSEYLSDCNFNSFVGYDWSCEEAREYIQPLLDKREFHIYNWEEYLPSNTRSQNFIDLFERRQVKSSYSFPVMYQTKIMGFFSIGFIKEVRRLSNEDINRIRNLCTQTGIALYHADLYKEAQKSIQAHAEFVNKLSSELKDPLDMIISFSDIKSEREVECKEEIEHLNIINENAHKLLYFLNDITQIVKTKLEN